MNQLSNGSIVSLSHDGRQRLALVEDVPKRKTTQVLIILDPGRSGQYEAIPVERSALTLVPESKDTQAARLRIKAKRESQGGLARMNRKAVADGRKYHDTDAGGKGGRGFPEKKQPPVILSSRTAHGGYHDWSGDMCRYMYGNREDYVLGRLRLEHPLEGEVLRLRGKGYPMEDVARYVGKGYWTAYKLLAAAKEYARTYRDAWNEMAEDDRSA